MVSRTEFKDDVLKLAVSVLQSARDPEHILKHAKYFSVPTKSELHRDCIKRLLNHPQLRPLINERYSIAWPSLAEMAAMPKGSLGFCMQQRLTCLGIDQLPMTLPLIDDEEDYVLYRLSICHDIQHVVMGLPISVAGEAAASAYNLITKSMPFHIGLLATWMTHGLIEPDEHRLIWEGINYGSQLGLSGVFLEAFRWEEGWERPLAEWRSELGLTSLLEISPFQDEIHRWETLSS